MYPLKPQIQFRTLQKRHSNSHLRLALCGLIAAVSIIYLSGCATIEAPVEELPANNDAALLLRIEDQQRVIEEQQQNIKELELQLTKKNAEIRQRGIREKEQDQVIEATGQEITRTQIKLHRLATRSSSASLIAEAEVAMNALNRQSDRPFDEQLKTQAQQLLDAAGLSFSQDDYAAATQYASQSIDFINMTVASNREITNRPTVVFSLPIRLQTTANVNLRQIPGTHASVKTVLKKGAFLTATAYQGNWLRVQTENNTQGWVSNTLIKVLTTDNAF
jgi:Bacterial SH3 domain